MANLSSLDLHHGRAAAAEAMLRDLLLELGAGAVC